MVRKIFVDDALPSKIKALRISLGLSQMELAVKSGVGVSTIQRAEYGDSRVTDGTYATILAALGEDLPQEIDTTNNVNDALVSVPLVSPRLSAGAGEVVESEEAVKYLAFRREWMSRKGSARDMVLFRVTGDSMRPTVLPGDIVMVDRARAELEEDRVHAISWWGEIAIKRLRRNESGKVEVISDNPAYPVRLADGDGFRILGRVVWLGREIE